MKEIIIVKKSNGIVTQLIQNILSNNSSVINLLHRSLYIANQLNLLNKSPWIIKELKGYKQYEEVPDYRKISCEIKALRDITGGYKHCKIENIDQIIQDSKLIEWKSLYPSYSVFHSLSEIEDICSENIQKDPIFQLPEYLYNYIIRNSIDRKVYISFPKSIDLIVDRFKFNNIIRIVKTNILEWAIEVKNLGIDSEGIDFTQEDKIIAEKAFAGMLSHNQNCQIVYAVNSSNSSQNTTDCIQSQNFEENDIEKIIQSIQKPEVLESFSSAEKIKVEKELYSLKKEKEPTKVQAILGRLRKCLIEMNKSGTLTATIQLITACIGNTIGTT